MTPKAQVRAVQQFVENLPPQDSQRHGAFVYSSTNLKPRPTCLQYSATLTTYTNLGVTLLLFVTNQTFPWLPAVVLQTWDQDDRYFAV